jgi:hypothetical protein
MAQNHKSVDPVIQMLSAIHSTVQDLLIMEGAKAGIGKADVRKIVGVGAARVTRIWKHLNLASKQKAPIK